MKKLKDIKNGVLWVRSLIVAVCSLVISLGLYFSGAFTFLENKTYDQRMILASKYKRPCQEIFFIGVDQESIDWAAENYGWSWPWPREAWGRMIEFFSAGNPNSIAFDILYSETSVYGEEDDQAFARAIEQSGKVILPVNVSGSGEEETAKYPIDVLRQSATLGNVTSLFDSDDIIRRGRLEYDYKGTVYPTLGTAPLVMTDNADFSKVPRLKDGSVLLRYPQSLDDYFPYWAWEIFDSYDKWKAGEEGYYVPEDFEDSYIYVAYYAPGLYDICSIPVSQVFPGVGVHITTLDNYLTDSFMHKIPEWLTAIFAVLLSFLGAASVAFSSARKSQKSTVVFMITGFVLGLALAVGMPYILFVKGWWLPLIVSMFSFFAAFIISVALSFTVEGKQKRFIKSAFSQCLSKDVVNQIVNDPSSFTLGGKNFDMSAIFTDIQKFSSFSELLTASQLGNLLNFYLTKMSDIIIGEYGTIDKYEGDAIVALVGAPVEMKDHAARACAAAVKMKKCEIELNAEIQRIASLSKPEGMNEDLYQAFKILVANGKTIFTRIGINSGEMIAGYFGSDNKKNYTMMGNNVNLASRLEGVNKQYCTGGILISQATREALGDRFVLRSLDRVRVVNVNTPIRLYEVLDEKSLADNALVSYAEDWEKFMESFESGKYDEALSLVKKLSQQKPEDKVALYYISLIEKYFINGKYPVESDGEGVAFNPEDGVFKLLQK